MPASERMHMFVVFIGAGLFESEFYKYCVDSIQSGSVVARDAQPTVARVPPLVYCRGWLMWLLKN